MARRDATKPLDADMLTEDLLGEVPVQKEEKPEPEPEPERKPTPHELRRKARQMSVTFPTPEWKQAIAKQVERWHMRPSDFLIYCVSYTMRAIKDGQAKKPAGDVDPFRHRAGEMLDLPWKP